MTKNIVPTPWSTVMPCMSVNKDITDKNNTDALFVPNASNVSNCAFRRACDY